MRIAAPDDVRLGFLTDSVPRGEPVLVAGVAVGGEELRPFGAAAVEGVAVDFTLDARHTAGGGVLPHGPLPAHIAFVGLRRDAPHPVWIIVQLTFEQIPVEGDVRINNRTL